MDYKHLRWNDDAGEYLLERTFTVKPQDNQTAQFKDLNKTITIENNLLSGGGTQGDIEFNDPWFVEADGGQPGIFHTYSSPFTPGSGVYAPYHGVFLDQNPQFQQGKPIYTVRAAQQQVIPFHGQDITWYFQGWEGDGVEFQDSTQTKTAVVFKANNAEARAVYKGHLASNSAAATAYNNSRKIVVDDLGYWHMVYVDNGQIYYTYSINNGATWQPEERVSSRFNTNRFPDICLEKVSPYRIAVVWGTGESEYDYHFSWRFRTQGTSGSWGAEWSTLDSWGIGATSPIKHASIWRGHHLYIMAKVDGGLGLYRFDGNELALLGQVPGTNDNAQNPAITAAPDNSGILYCTWEQQYNIYFAYYYISGGYFGNREQVSSTMSGFILHQQPSISFDLDDKINVAWSGFDVSLNAYVLFHRQRASNLNGKWEPINELYYSYYELTHPSVGSFLDPAYPGWVNIALKFGSDNIRVIQYDRESWNWLPDWYTGSNPSLNDQGEQLMLVATDNTTELPYLITNDLFSPDGQQHRRPISKKEIYSDDPWDNPSPEHKETFRKELFLFSNLPDLNMQGEVDLSFGNLWIQTTDSTIEWPFLALSDSGDYRRFLRTSPLTVTSEMQNVTLHYGVAIKNLRRPVRVPALPLYRLQLLDAVSGEPLMMLRQVLLDSLSGPDVNLRDSLQIDLQPFRDRQVILRMLSIHHLLARNGQKPEQMNLYKFYENTPGLHALSKPPLETPEKIPEDFDMSQNYPNPFNPTTTISFDLPHATRITLHVFDVNGRQVRTLAEGEFAAGSHQMVWDGRDDNGVPVASGVYFYRLTTGSGFVATRKMVLLR
ncbi:MAG: T9SS C-terminal target domain-containing protein [Methanobacteriota archaeon]|nr:MAG: T9SS C-terminal target domain-containing protein [Euryarchaeota archaeon]